MGVLSARGPGSSRPAERAASPRRLDEVRRRRVLPETAIADGLHAIEAGRGFDPEDYLYLTTIARCVAELGGHIKVLAVFPE